MNFYRKLIDLLTVGVREPEVTELNTDPGDIPAEPVPPVAKPKNNIPKYGRKFRRN